MGNSCAGGKPDKFDFEESWRTKYLKLVDEHKKLVDHLEEELRRKSNDNIENEQINLLKYKVELLLTMLAMEEKSKEVLSNRVETLKWVILSQGTSEEQINELLLKYRGKTITSPDELNFEIDISSAFEKMKIAFQSYRHDIIGNLIDDDGNVILNLSKESFIERLSSTTTVLKKDLQILALRFYDGKTVSTTEFLAFFTTPESIRQVQNAHSAVRMSEDMLDISIISRTRSFSKSQQFSFDNPNSLNSTTTTTNNNNGLNSPIRSRGGIGNSTDWRNTSRMSLSNSTTNLIDNSEYETFYKRKRTKNLDFSLTKLVITWKYIKDSFSMEFKKIRQGHNRTISANEFKTMLIHTCGDKTHIIQNISNYHLSVNEETLIKLSILSPSDIDILIAHFEMGSRIHFAQFYDFMEKRLLNADMFEIQNLSNIEDVSHHMNQLESKGNEKKNDDDDDDRKNRHINRGIVQNNSNNNSNNKGNYEYESSFQASPVTRSSTNITTSKVNNNEGIASPNSARVANNNNNNISNSNNSDNGKFDGSKTTSLASAVALARVTDNTRYFPLSKTLPTQPSSSSSSSSLLTSKDDEALYTLKSPNNNNNNNTSSTTNNSNKNSNNNNNNNNTNTNSNDSSNNTNHLSISQDISDSFLNAQGQPLSPIKPSKPLSRLNKSPTSPTAAAADTSSGSSTIATDDNHMNNYSRK